MTRPNVRRWRLLTAGSLLTAVAGSNAHAQMPQVPTTDEIVVTGQREGTLDLKRLRRGEAVFEADRARFAPESKLMFQLRPREGVALAGTTLTLRSGNTDVPVLVDPLGRFTLPPSLGEGWELVHNRGKAVLAVRPLVFSPGASEADRPLGDLRLQCRVGWELMKTSYSLFTRAAFDALGGCSSSRIGIFFVVPQPIAAADIAFGGAARSLPIAVDHRSYRPPISDPHRANSDRVRLQYR